MVDSSLILDAIVAVSIAAGAFFAVMELRSLSRGRKTELLMRFNELWSSKDFEEAFIKIRDLDTKDPEEIEERCSKLSLWMTVDYISGIGDLAREDLLDRKFVLNMIEWSLIWERLEPWIFEMRHKIGNPAIGSSLEWAAKLTREG